MPRRKFIYSKEKQGVVEVTPPEIQKICQELHDDAESRSAELNYGGPGNGKRRNVSGKWPMASDSLAINPEQITYEQSELRKHGITCDYELVHDKDPETGRKIATAAKPIFRDRAHRKAYHRALGFYDGDAGYSDPEPLNYRTDMTRENIKKHAKAEMDRLQHELYQMLHD